jgi:hypothetical protein
MDVHNLPGDRMCLTVSVGSDDEEKNYSDVELLLIAYGGRGITQRVLFLYFMYGTSKSVWYASCRTW